MYAKNMIEEMHTDKYSPEKVKKQRERAKERVHIGALFALFPISSLLGLNDTQRVYIIVYLPVFLQHIVIISCYKLHLLRKHCNEFTDPRLQKYKK